ncbi:MAG: hypothetical protein K6F35_09485 [Lachnospiraceae bacterium]|nr:hypothetical protein [Lachnospiraceae bacterium]
MKGKNNSFMPLFCGFIVSSILTFVVIMTTWNIGVVYEQRIQIFDIAICLIWAVLLIKDKGWKQYKIIEIGIAAILFISLGLYMGNAWHVGYITDTPLIGINAEKEGIFRDTLYHNALASSIAYYGYPSVLVNSGAFQNYHFGSHMILGLISKFLGIPTIFTYCYIYPVLFFSLFPSLVLSVAYEVRNYRGDKNNNSIVDIIVLLEFMTFYTLPQNLAEGIGTGKSFSWLISESYCVAIVLGLIFYKILILFMNKGFFEHRNFYLGFILVIIPAFIVLIALSKISVGLIVTFMICYYLFRKKGMDIKYLLLEAFYVIVVFAVHYLPTMVYSPIPSGTNEKVYSWMFLAYLRNNFAPQMWGIRILSLFLYALVFIAFRLNYISTFNDFKSAIRNREIVIEEMLFFTCIVGALPGMFIDIGGGSAFYFFSIQRVIAITLLLAYNIPYELWGYAKTKDNFMHKVVVTFLLICLSFNFVVYAKAYAGALKKDCHMGAVQREESMRRGSFWSVVNGINELTDGKKSDYYIYVCESASVWNKYKDLDSAILFYPALTGIVCIGELYFDNGVLYVNNGMPKGGGYQYRPLVQDKKMTKEDAFEKAKEDGKKAIIYIYENTFSVREINYLDG